MPRALPDKAIPTLRELSRGNGTFLDRDFIIVPTLGRTILARIVERGWIQAHGPELGGTRYRITEAGKLAIQQETLK
jgi:hypothetical protein